jgi:hypothetical protein
VQNTAMRGNKHKTTLGRFKTAADANNPAITANHQGQN